MPLSVEYADMFLSKAVLERQCKHTQEIRSFLRQWCDFFSEKENAGLLLMALYPINKMIVDAGDNVLGLIEDAHRGTADHMGQTIDAYISADQHIHTVLAAATQALGGSPSPFSMPKRPELGPAERSASGWYGGADHDRFTQNLEGLAELAEYSIRQTYYLGKRTGRAFSSDRSIVEAQDASSYLVKPEAPDSPLEDLRWKAGFIIGSVDWIIEQLTGQSLLNDYLLKYIIGDWRAVQRASIAWGEIGDALIAVGENDSEILPALSEWTGKGSEAANAFIAALAGATTLLHSAAGTASTVLSLISLGTKILAGLITDLLLDIETTCLGLLTAGTIPVAGWIAASAELVVALDEIYGAISKLYMAYNFIFDLIESAIRAQGQLNEIRLTIANIVEAIIRGVAARA